MPQVNGVYFPEANIIHSHMSLSNHKVIEVKSYFDGLQISHLFNFL